MSVCQIGPYPEVLAYLVARLHYKQGWHFSLADIDRGQGSKGLTLKILVFGPDSYHPDETIGVNHYFIVPTASYNEQNWRRWLLDRVLDVESHEVCEHFRLDGDKSGAGFRPYAPNHGPGNDPYFIREMTTDEERRTSFRGEVTR